MNEVPIRLLRETLQARGAAGPSAACLDAGTVAAWADGTLGAGERRAAEAHAADCVWCQALVAAMAKMDPQTAPRSWWRSAAVGWLVPASAAAVAVLVWMNAPTRGPASSSTAVSREIRQEPARAAQDALSNARPQTPGRENSVPSEPRLSAPPRARRETAKVNGGTETNATVNPQGAAADTRSREAPAAVAEAFSANPGAPPAAAPPVPADPAPVSRPPQRAAAASAPPSSALTLQRAESAAVAAAKAPALLLDARQSAAPLIVSSNGSSRWRLMAGGAVQHSTDGGATWELQSTGVTVPLTAGASPAPSVCWLVGPGGIVLLSTDGRSWRRIMFPETVDLISVQATSDKAATVVAANGRTFSTIDGGETWTRFPPF